MSFKPTVFINAVNKVPHILISKFDMAIPSCSLTYMQLRIINAVSHVPYTKKS